MTETQTRFARRTFFIAGIYGLLAVAPLYFLESQLNQNFPPAITHPENFYGFVGLALVWQFAFLLISRDVMRYRPLMPIAVLEKLSFSLAVIVLYLQQRVSVMTLGLGLIDLFIGVMFSLAYLGLRDSDKASDWH